ncbi:hypothetical protein TcasGA2_TC001318 [Tribolium castaneum]|uniref:Uncharacterized protein n=1 Tax=Tribolium castaneum TaxID=7070 RepID=D6WBX1_TRICA|nr:PREDICTED: uncharacterized protein LOC103313485 [Tribolium castaneum]EEZ98754.1 hypothetical protein TcasGA2_TC001318 [Tribolium castaneum]|eukprot:XP_008195062.1 PREDICTED: uncharacterized protein LOC103313485 [Tribolium castaneum]
MSDFKRSPSKVWWASESLEWREISGSPGSQDSGFSDTETSPPIPKNVAEQIAKNSDCSKAGNLSSNYQEKTTPDKSIKQSPLYTKNSPRVSRNLFKDVKDVVKHQYSKEVACLSPRKVRSFSEELPGRSYGLLNRSAPAVLEEIKDEEESLSNSLSSDCESELECLFNGALESPKHTSTPKMKQTRHKVPLNLYLKYQRQEK